MITPARKAQIQQMETRLSQIKDALEHFRWSYQAWESLIPEFQQLMQYYGSEEWQEDKDLSEKESLDFPHGVLSEDEVYNLYQEQRQMAIELMRSALKILE